MDTDFKHKQRFNPKSNRLKHYDYSQNGAYFITICTKDRVEYFGKIVEGEMILSEMGKIIEDDIQQLQYYYDNVVVDKCVIMPDHVHFFLFLVDVINKDVSEKHLYTGKKDY